MIRTTRSSAKLCMISTRRRRRVERAVKRVERVVRRGIRVIRSGKSNSTSETLRFGANRLLLECLFENSLALDFEEIHGIVQEPVNEHRFKNILYATCEFALQNTLQSFFLVFLEGSIVFLFSVFFTYRLYELS